MDGKHTGGSRLKSNRIAENTGRRRGTLPRLRGGKSRGRGHTGAPLLQGSSKTPAEINAIVSQDVDDTPVVTVDISRSRSRSPSHPNSSDERKSQGSNASYCCCCGSCVPRSPLVQEVCSRTHQSRSRSKSEESAVGANDISQSADDLGGPPAVSDSIDDHWTQTLPCDPKTTPKVSDTTRNDGGDNETVLIVEQTSSGSFIIKSVKGGGDGKVVTGRKIQKKDLVAGVEIHFGQHKPSEKVQNKRLRDQEPPGRVKKTVIRDQTPYHSPLRDQFPCRSPVSDQDPCRSPLRDSSVPAQLKGHVDQQRSMDLLGGVEVHFQHKTFPLSPLELVAQSTDSFEDYNILTQPSLPQRQEAVVAGPSTSNQHTAGTSCPRSRSCNRSRKRHRHHEPESDVEKRTSPPRARARSCCSYAHLAPWSASLTCPCKCHDPNRDVPWSSWPVFGPRVAAWVQDHRRSVVDRMRAEATDRNHVNSR